MKLYKSLKFIGIWFLLLAVLGCSLVVFADTDIGGGSSGESGGSQTANGGYSIPGLWALG